jgi:hypothetical protein
MGISTILILHCYLVLNYFIQKVFVSFLFMPSERDYGNLVQYSYCTVILFKFSYFIQKEYVREKMEVLYNPLTTAL